MVYIVGDIFQTLLKRMLDFHDTVRASEGYKLKIHFVSESLSDEVIQVERHLQSKFFFSVDINKPAVTLIVTKTNKLNSVVC